MLGPELAFQEEELNDPKGAFDESTKGAQEREEPV